MNKVDSINKYVNKNLYNILIGLLVVLLLVFVLNVFFVSSANSVLKEKAELIKEANKPSKIQLSIIDCNGCFDVLSIVDSVKSKNVDVTDEEVLDFDSEEAKSLIEKYNVQKLPFVLVSGEVDKLNINDFELVDGTLVLSEVGAPYFDVESNGLKGEVSVIEIIDSSCEDCTSLMTILDGLGQAGVSISSWDKFEYNSTDAIKVINKYGIKRAPVILISKDIDYYTDVKQGLLQLGLNERGDYYELDMAFPPYRDLSKNKIVGIVDLIMLKDESCVKCYDVELNKQILQRFGMKIGSENIYDVDSAKGKELVSKYNIVNVPIIIMSPDSKEYEPLVSAWEGIGSVESDGWFIMRKPEIIGTVKNIRNGVVMTKEQQQGGS